MLLPLQLKGFNIGLASNSFNFKLCWEVLVSVSSIMMTDCWCFPKTIPLIQDVHGSPSDSLRLGASDSVRAHKHYYCAFKFMLDPLLRLQSGLIRSPCDVSDAVFVVAICTAIRDGCT